MNPGAQAVAEVNAEGATVRAVNLAALYPQVSGKGLSLGDQACLALAQRLAVRAVTAEHIRGDLSVDIAVQLIRPFRG